MLKKSFIITLIFALSRVILLVNQVVNGKIFGASYDLDSFLSAAVLPTLIATAVYATLADVYLSRVIHVHQQDEHQLFHKLYWQLGLATTGLAIVLSLISDFVVSIIYHDQADPQIRSAIALELQYLFLSLPIAVVAALGGAYYQRRHQFNRFPVIQFVASAAHLIFVLLFHQVFGVWVLVIGFYLNFVIHLFGTLPQDKIKPNWRNLATDWRETKIFLASWLPIILANLLMTSNAILIQSLALAFGEGYPTYFNIIFKMFSMAAGLITIGIQTVFITHVADYLRRGQHERAHHHLNRAKISTMAVSLLTAIAVLILGPIIVNTIYVGHKFTPDDARTINQLFPYFFFPAIFWGMTTVFAQGLIMMRRYWLIAGLAFVSLMTGVFAITWLAPIVGMFTAMACGLTLISVIFILSCEISLRRLQAAEAINSNHLQQLR